MRRATAVQLSRKLLQVSVVAFVVYTALGGPFRNYKLAHNHRRLVGLMEGDLWAFLYGLNEDALALFGEPYRASFDFLGFPWAARVLGIDTMDPVLALSLALQTGELPLPILASAVLPVGLALALGKVFCSHLCPMRLAFELGALVRAGLAKLGVVLPHLHSDVRLGGFALAGGLVASLLAGSGVWFFILPYVSLSAGAFLLITAGTTAGLGFLALAWFLIDVLLAPGYFCHNLCPTGFLLEQLGRFAPFRLHKLGEEACPGGCHLCQKTCPYGLSPRDRSHRPACDNCGRCAAACPSERLERRISLPVVASTVLLCVLAVAACPAPASAHHNKGLPHYGYFENYPQVPTEEYIAIQDGWEIGATIFNFQGLDRETADTPNDVKVYLYLYDLEADRAYTGPLDVEIRRGADLVARFARVEVDEEAVYSTRETLPESGDYLLVALVGDERVSLPFHVELKDGSVDPLALTAIGLPVALVFGLALYGRRRRRRRPRARSQAITMTSTGLLLGLSLASAAVPVVRADGPTICTVCGMVDCTMDHGESAAPSQMQHFRTTDGAIVMVMGGIPLWLFLAGIALVIVASFVAVEVRKPSTSEGFRLNLIRHKRVYRRMRSRWLQAVPQLLMVGVLGLLIYAGLLGSSARNITPVAVWTLWWAGLIFAVLVLGSAWCFVCPWDGLANLASRLRAAARVETLSLALPYPKALANMYPAIALFVGLTWLELGYGVTNNPRLTAYMGLAMGALAIVGALLWDGKRFCAHACPVGRICGIYSNFSPIEIRARNPRTCQVCTTEDCLHGNARGYPCPTGISLKTIEHSTACTACTECIKSCDKHNVALNIRPFAADLRKAVIPRTDEAWLALMLLSLTLFHGLSMTPAWENFQPGGTSILKWMAVTLGTPRLLNFSLAMAVAVALPVGIYTACCSVAARLSADGVRARELFVAYSFSLLPVALFYHLAHNLMHLLMEGGEIVPLLSDPLGRGADLFGTTAVHVGSLVDDQALWSMQVALIVVGHVYGIVVAHRIGHRMHRDRRAARLSLIPIPAAMVAISICGLWLMHLDMNMRMGRM